MFDQAGQRIVMASKNIKKRQGTHKCVMAHHSSLKIGNAVENGQKVGPQACAAQ